MRIFKMMLVMILVAPFVAFGENLEYDYIEDNSQGKIENRAKPTIKRKIRKKPNLNQTQQVLDSKKKKIQQTINDRKEANGPIIGAGWATGIYLGGEMQQKRYITSYSGTSYSYNYYETSYFPFAVYNGFDILAGYKWFFGQGGFGMRLYGEYIGLFSNIEQNIHTIAINYDLLFNWVKTRPFKFGMILGVQPGLHIFDRKHSDNANGIMVGLNVGFRFVIYDKSAIEVLVVPKLGSLLPSDYTSFGFMFGTVGNIRFVYTF